MSAGGPDGRTASERALLDAAAALFAEVGPNAVSVRAVAQRAGVNHGLVHHYFGSKAGLVRAVLDDLAARTGGKVAAGAFAAGEADDEMRLNLRVLARVVLDGAAPPGFQSAFPAVDYLATVAREVYDLDDEQARTRAVQAMAMAVGWLLFEPWLLAAGGFGDADAARLRAALPVAMGRLAQPDAPSQSPGPNSAT